ncbi:MAG: HD domain-containing phosphohydrolase [Bacillota bacterium]
MKDLTAAIPDPEPASLILESVPNPVIMVSNGGIILFVNRSMENFLNGGIILFVNRSMENFLDVDRKEIIGKHLVEALYNGQVYNRRGGFCSPLLETLFTGREFICRPVQIKTVYNLAPRQVLVNTFIARDRGGEVKGACAMLFDNLRHWNNLRPSVTPTEHFETIYAFAEAIGARDCYTMGHSEKVAEYSRLIAEKMGLNQQQADLAYLCGVVHDVGKIGIPEEVLNKSGPLNSEEYRLIMGHPQMGASILSHISWLEDIIPVIEAHHERYDGTGYPAGLKGDEIPLLSRILAVADAFEAMTSDRSYRKAYPFEKALDELVRNCGTQFDPLVVEVFLEILKEYS